MTGLGPTGKGFEPVLWGSVPEDNAHGLNQLSNNAATALKRDLP